MTVTGEDRALVEAINATARAGLTVEGRAEQGTSGGAVLVTLADGRPGVVTRFLGPLRHAHRTAQVLARARRRGLPVPEHHLVVEIGTDVLVVQERLPGQPPTAVTPDVVTAIIELDEQLADVLRGTPDVPVVPLCLTVSGDPHPRHEVLAEHGERSRRVLRRIQDIGGGGDHHAEGDDLLHIDLTSDNVLFDADGTVTGLVDWNLGAYRGDRHLALVKTRFDLEWQLREPEPPGDCVAAAEQLDVYLETTVAPPTLLRYWAHRCLYQLHWTLPSAPPAVVDWHLDLAETRLGVGLT